MTPESLMKEYLELRTDIFKLFLADFVDYYGSTKIIAPEYVEIKPVITYFIIQNGNNCKFKGILRDVKAK